MVGFAAVLWSCHVWCNFLWMSAKWKKEWNKQKLCETFLAKEPLSSLMSALRGGLEMVYCNLIELERLFLFLSVLSCAKENQGGVILSFLLTLSSFSEQGCLFWNYLLNILLNPSASPWSVLHSFPITSSQFIDLELLENWWLCKTPKHLILDIPPIHIQIDWFNQVIHVASELS